jgi:peptidoglycan/xylan/chitin deacetylase (PgdA/CDA1 family)
MSSAAGDATQAVALSFDDGPHPEGTRRILEALAVHDVKATFFVWGAQAQAHPDVVSETLAEGHSVQPHCWEHTSHFQMSAAAIGADIDAVLALLRELGVPTPQFWRTPWGHLQSGVTRAAAEQRALALTGWTIDSTDYAGNSASEMHANVTQELERGPGEPATLLMHDSNLEPIQRRSRSDVGETVELVRRLTADRRYVFGPLLSGLDDGLEEHPRSGPPPPLARRVLRRLKRDALAARRRRH